MTASLYQSGSRVVSAEPCAMRLTLGAQRAHRQVVDLRQDCPALRSTSTLREVARNTRATSNAIYSEATPRVEGNYFPETSIDWLPMHSHLPLRSSQVSVQA